MQHKQSNSVYHLHVLRVLLVGVLIFAFFLVRGDMPLTAPANNNGQVLAYSTDMSVDKLLAATNSARINTSLAPLAMNQQLNISAQAKADDMVKNNYWSHESPDGSQPWIFFEKADYKYSAAGENLAYGFTDSKSTIEAWLKSPSHRSNLLGKYKEVGFGIASSSHYQGGNYTVIVAHYATPNEHQITANSAHSGQPPVATGTVASINTAQQLFGGTPPILLVISASLFAGAGLMFIFTHRRLMAHAIAKGERIVIAHPLVDASILIVVATLILSSTRATIG